jgi:hypothetical protein
LSDDQPRSLSINAWDGERGAVSGPVGDALLWGLRSELPQFPKYLFADAPPNLMDWRDDRVGWGLILPDDDELSSSDKARALDAPNPIRELLADRADAPVLRYRKDSPNRFGTLLRYLKDGTPVQPDIAGSAFGVARDAIPYYLLICASPGEIPWDLQYALNARYAVGRLDLDETGLANYVGALRSEWKDARAAHTSVVVWATDHGGGDMSETMRLYVAKPLWEQISADADIGPGSVMIDRDSGGATTTRLLEALDQRRPGLVVTTSHGVTLPLEDPEAMGTNLGLLVGDDHTYAQPGEILAGWEPDGAIWYAHACCSAGSRDGTVYDDLVGSDSPIGRVLRAVAAVGSMTAPLPTALLGAAKPARAFIGHVEPTFDWTIRQPKTRQSLTAGIKKALWDGLYRKGSAPVGHAFQPFYGPIGTLAAQQVSLREEYAVGADVSAQLLAAQLSARDRMSTVILGDPSVRLEFGQPG